MKFSSITLLNDKRTEVDQRLRDNPYNFTKLRGWDIELVGAAVLLSHPDRVGTLVIPFAAVERAELLTEPEAEALDEKRGPGRPKKSA